MKGRGTGLGRKGGGTGQEGSRDGARLHVWVRELGGSGSGGGGRDPGEMLVSGPNDTPHSACLASVCACVSMVSQVDVFVMVADAQVRLAGRFLACAPARQRSLAHPTPSLGSLVSPPVLPAPPPAPLPHPYPTPCNTAPAHHRRYLQKSIDSPTPLST